jgi:hypothetical protein
MGVGFKRLVTSPMVGALVSFEGFHGVVSETPEIRDVRPPCVRLNVRFSVAPGSLMFLLLGCAHAPDN